LSYGSGADALDEERSHQLRKAELRLIELLQTGPQRYQDLLAKVLELRLVWKSDVSGLLANWRKAQRVEVTGLGPRERTPKPDSTIRLI